MKVNGNILFIVAAVFGLATIAGIITLDVTHNASQSGFFVASVGTLLTTLLGFGALLVSNNKQSDKLSSVEMKVNGNLSRILDAALQNTSADPSVVADVAAQTGVSPTVVNPPQSGSTEGH